MAALIDSVMQDSANQNISVSGTSAQTTAITSPTGQQFVIVRIALTTDAYVAFGPNPTATSSNAIYRAGVEYKKMNSGDKAAFLQVAAAGSASVCTQV